MSEVEESQENRIIYVSVKDPVCGMAVNPAEARGKAHHEAETYYFCSPGCMHKFVSSPEKYLSAGQKPQATAAVQIGAATKLDKDPVCGMNVDPSKAAASVEYEGKLYHFCSRGCAEKFKAYPEKFLSPNYKPGGMGAMVQLGAKPVQISSSGSVAETPPTITLASADAASSRSPAVTGAGAIPAYVCPMDPEVRQAQPGACPKCGMALEREIPLAATKTQWTCPMHPEIVRDGPGACPICGMALEPKTVTASQEENPELRDMTRRFWTSVLLGVPLVAYAMLRMGPLAHVLTPRTGTWLEFALATPIVLWCGWPFFARGWASVKFRSPNMFTLIAMGVGVAYVYSAVATVAPGIFPEPMRGMHGQPEVYFEAAAAIIALVLLGQVLELRARSRTSSAIRALLDLSPKLARIMRDDGSEYDVPLDQVRVGD